MGDKPESTNPADEWLYRLCVAGLVMMLLALAICAVWPLVVGGAR